MRLKKLVLAIVLALSAFLNSCSGPAIKVYKIENPTGLVRKQDKEIKSFIESEGYFCVSPENFELVINKYLQCIKE
jgi:hypothetical protein